MDDDSNFLNPEDIRKLNPNDRRQLEVFLNNEAQKSQVQKSVHELTEVCFKRCVTSSITSGKLASKEDTCMQNCVERFMDSNLAVLKHLETLRAGQ